MTGCVTKMLWAPEGKEVVHVDDGNLKYEDVEPFSFDESSSGEPMPTWAKVALTPFAILLDVTAVIAKGVILGLFDTDEKETRPKEDEEIFEAAKPLNNSDTGNTAPWRSSDR